MRGDSNFVGIGLMVGQDRYGSVVHNSPLWAFSDLGLVGLGWLACLHGSVLLWLRRLWRADRSPLVKALFGAHAIMAVASLGVEATFQRQWWFIFALVIAATAIRVEPDRASSPQMASELRP